MTLVYAVFVLLLVTFGAVVMGLEILSSNLMSPYFGGSIYIWGSIISSFMVHFSIGYVLGGWLSRRLPRVWLLALGLVVCSLWVLMIPAIYKPVCEWVSDGIVDVRVGSLIAMNVIFLVPVSIMAMVSPYIIGITASWQRQSGLTAGMVLFISTVGSFAGTNITAFYLISLFPVSRIVTGLGILCLVVSLAVLTMRVDGRMPVPSACRDAGQ
ncbi:MAG: fused MFS/spermidine synthase [Deltaproteobacteria bacterium]|nr:fused MFS/spermidine synthase [Deltaproteobacteria bacterium]